MFHLSTTRLRVMDNKESDDKKAETQRQEVLSKHCRALDLKRAVWDNKLFT